MPPRDLDQGREYGSYFAPEVKNVISLTLAFAKAAGNAQKDKADNLVVSPYNAAACLAMVAKGTDGETREEMARTLFGTDGAGLDNAVAAYAALNTEMLAANKGQVTVATANGVWANKDLVHLRQAYEDDLKATMGADVSAENYADPATVAKINAWAAENTNGLIKEIIKGLDADDAVVLASALYFKGEWTRKFDKKLTQDKAFTSDGADASLTPMMRQEFKDGLKYQQGADYDAVSLTYGESNYDERKQPTMRIVLVRPTDETVSARDWLAQQQAGAVPAWLDNYAFQKATGPVEMPHLTMKQKHDLKPALQEMGIQSVFDSRADFTKMVERDGEEFYVSKVSMDIDFESNEEGSEAASVTTAVVTKEFCVAPPARVDIKLDRSFVFAVQDIKTNAVLFVGAVNKPNKEMKPAKAATPKL
jgi:serine protease inhibitor